MGSQYLLVMIMCIATALRALAKLIPVEWDLIELLLLSRLPKNSVDDKNYGFDLL